MGGVRGLAFGAALILCTASGASAANDVIPPFDAAALRVQFGTGERTDFVCPDVPAPVTSVAVESKYAPGTNSSEIDPERLKAYQALAGRLKNFASPLVAMANAYLRTRPADMRIAQCGIEWLATWARARALEEPEDRQGEAVRAWNLPPIALAYLQFRDGSAISDEDQLLIEAWIERIGARVMTDYSEGQDLPSRWNNHRYWAGWAVMTAAAVVNDDGMFDWAIESARTGLRAVTADGFLPLELDRGKRALGYHVFAAEALVMLAAAASANNIDLFAENDGALLRLTETTLRGLSDSSGFETVAGVVQDLDFDTAGTKLAWVEILLRHADSVPGADVARKLTNTISLAAGGDVRLLFARPSAARSAARAELDQRVAAARAVSDAEVRQEAFLDALAGFDSLSVTSPDEVQGFDIATLVVNAAESIVSHAQLLSPDDPAFQTALGSLRDVLPRVRDPIRQLDLYGDLAELEMRGDPADAIDTIMKISARIAVLERGEDRDRLRSTILRLALAIPDVANETIARWAIDIETPRLRVVALRAVALARIASGQASKELFRAVAIKDDAERTAALTDLVTRYASERRFQSALFAALAIPDDAVATRDDALAAIFTSQLAVNFRPDAVYAPFAISDDLAREMMLGDLAEYAVRRSRLSLAREIAFSVDSAESAYRAWSAIAAHARSQGFAKVFADAFVRAREAASGIDDAGRRQHAWRVLAWEAVEAGDEAQALEVAEPLGDSTFVEALTTRAALRLVASGDVEDARIRLEQLEDPVNRSAVAAAMFRYYAGKAMPLESAAMSGLVTTDEGRIRLLIAEAELVLGDQGAETFDPVAAGRRLADAETRLAGIGDALLHQELAAGLAAAYRSLGDLAAVERLAEAAPTEAEHDGLRPIWLGAIARLDDPVRALENADSIETGLRSREMGEIAKSQFERGDVAGAIDTASGIPGDAIRVRVFREMAETHMDASRATAFAGDARGLPEAAPGSENAARRLGRHVIQAVDGAAVGQSRPELPDADGVTGDTVRGMVPVVAPGRAMVIPTGFSNFNEKFSYIRYLNSLDFVGDDENVFARGQRTLFPSFIIVESGVFDLPSLKSQIEQGGGAGSFLTSDGRIYQLNVPLLIGRDATLVITSADVEELRLNTAANTYIVNSGTMFLVGSKLTSWDPGSGSPTRRSKRDWLDFNAFYVGWSGSKTYVADAHVNGLGYGNGKSYGFVLSSGPENVLRATSNAMPKPTGIVVDSLFTDMYYGFYSYEAEDVQVVGNTYINNAIYAIDPHDWSKRLTFAYNTTLGTEVKHGIVTSREVRDSHIVGNITSGNAGSGILLDRMSNDNVIAYNLSVGNHGDGLTLYESSCNLVYRNTFTGNARAGVRLRNSADVLFADNTVTDNREAGFSAYVSRLEDDPRQASRDLALDPYHPYTDFAAVHNVITGNGRGAVAADGVSAMVLAGNRLSGEGDAILKGFGLGDAGPKALSLASTGVAVRDACAPVRPATKCAFRDAGHLGGDAVAGLEAEMPPEAAACDPRTTAASPVAVQVAGGDE